MVITKVANTIVMNMAMSMIQNNTILMIQPMTTIYPEKIEEFDFLKKVKTPNTPITKIMVTFKPWEENNPTKNPTSISMDLDSQILIVLLSIPQI